MGKGTLPEFLNLYFLAELDVDPCLVRMTHNVSRLNKWDWEDLRFDKKWLTVIIILSFTHISNFVSSVI